MVSGWGEIREWILFSFACMLNITSSFVCETECEIELKTLKLLTLCISFLIED